jgi:hypothetical protein
VTKILDLGEESVSVAIQEIKPTDWAEQVYLRRIGVQGACIDPVKGENGKKIAFGEIEKF